MKKAGRKLPTKKQPRRIAGRRKNEDRTTPWHDQWYAKVLLPALEVRGARRRLAEFLAGADATSASIHAIQNKFAKVARGETIFNGDEVLGIQAWLKSQK